ncbi:hypothetical protein GGI17_005101 [Coemansia sp. S146]|nr:hypothetical protein GGI17_005101 [Coemansia sp. S146]
MADDTIQQVYMRVTQKMQDCQKQLAQIDAQMSANQRETRLAALTQREIQDLDSSVPLYKSMGKMFIQESKEDLLKDIAQSASDAKVLIDALEKKQKNYANKDEIIATFVVGINPGIEALEDLATKVLNIYYGHDPTISHFALVKGDGIIPNSDYERDHEWNWVIYVMIKKYKPHQQPRGLIDVTKLSKEEHLRILDANRAQYINTEVSNRTIPCYNIRVREQERARRQVQDSYYLNQNSMRRPSARGRGGQPA